jgi:hypothetical protein
MVVIQHGKSMTIDSLVIGLVLIFYYVGIGSAVANKIDYINSFSIKLSIYLFLGLSLSTIFEAFYFRKFVGEYFEIIQIIFLLISLYGLYNIKYVYFKKYIKINFIYFLIILILYYELMDNSVYMLTKDIYFRPFQDLIFYKGASELVYHDFYNQFSGSDTYFPVITILVSKIISIGYLNVLEVGKLLKLFPVLLFIVIMLGFLELIGIRKHKRLILIILSAGVFDKFFLVNNNISFYGSMLLLGLFINMSKKQIITNIITMKIMLLLVFLVILYKSLFFLDLGILTIILIFFIATYIVDRSPINLLLVIGLIILQLHRASMLFILASIAIISISIILNYFYKKNAI